MPLKAHLGIKRVQVLEDTQNGILWPRFASPFQRSGSAAEPGARPAKDFSDMPEVIPWTCDGTSKAPNPINEMVRKSRRFIALRSVKQNNSLVGP